MIDENRLEQFKAKVEELKKKPRYLRHQDAKAVLEEAVRFKFPMKEMEVIFGRTQTTLEKLFSFHQVDRPWKISDYSDEQLAIAEVKSREIQEASSLEDAKRLTREMNMAINAQREKEGKRRVTRNAINCALRNLRPDLKFGYSLERDFSDAQFEIIERAYRESLSVATPEASGKLVRKMWQEVNEQRARENKKPITAIGRLRKAIAVLRSNLEWGYSTMKQKKIKAEAWTDEADKVLVSGYVESRQYSLYTAEGRKKLKDLRKRMTVQLNEIGFRGYTTEKAFSARMREITPERLSSLGFGELQTPLRWGSKSNSPQCKAVEKKILVRMNELILQGALRQEGGDEAFLEQVKAEFAEDIRKDEVEINLAKFRTWINKVIWAEGPDSNLSALEQIIRDKGDINVYIQSHEYLTAERIWAKAKQITGLTNILHPPSITIKPTLSGIGRILDDEEMTEYQNYKLPRYGFKSPYKLKLPKHWKIAVPNAFSIGIDYDRRIEKNTSRRALSQAKRDGSSVVVTSGLIDLDTTRASGSVKALKASYSGLDAKIDFLSPNYREEARRILETRPPDETLYMTAREAFNELMAGLRKVSRGPDLNNPENEEGIPEFNGPTLIAFGPKEEEVAVAAAAAAVTKNNIVKIHKRKAELKAVMQGYRPFEKQMDKLQKALHALQAALEAVETEEQRNAINQQIVSVSEEIRRTVETEIQPRQQKINDLVELEARTRITSVAPQEWKRFINAALAYIAKRIERAMPNSKVIGRGTTYIQINDKIGEFHIPGHLRVTPNVMSEYVRAYGAKVRRKQMADFVVILHPHTLYYDVNTREVDSRGRRERYVQIFQAPLTLDGNYLREMTADVVRKVHPLGKVINDERFAPGMMELSCQNGIISGSTYSIDALGYYERFQKAAPAVLRRLKLLDGKYIYALQNNDEHIGGPSKEFLECRSCRVRMGVGEAALHLFRHAGYGWGDGKKLLPFHLVFNCDDGVQGYHFEWSKQPHHHELSREELLEQWDKAREALRKSRSVDKNLVVFDNLQRLQIYQEEIRGEPWLENQVNEMKDMLERNADMYLSIIHRFVSSNLKLKGISEHLSLPYAPIDRRDVGVLNLWNGNHAAKTVDYHKMEGEEYARHLQTCLTAIMGKKYASVFKKYVRAPRDGNIYLGLGTVQAPGGVSYGLEVCSKPQARPVWTDLLKGQITTALRRGNIRRIFELTFVLWFCGDKHFLAQIRGPMDLFTMGAPGTHTDIFAEIAGGLPPNNTGVNVVGVPAGGPDDGPIILKPLMYTDLRKFLEEGSPDDFDMEEFFPNPL